MQKYDGDSIKCIGAYKDCRYYYDGRHDQFFLLTPNFRITRSPAHYSEDVTKWCANQREQFFKSLTK